MELAIRERAIRPKSGSNNFRAADPLLALSWLLEVFSITEGKSLRRPAFKECTTQTIHHREKHAGRPVIVASGPRAKRYDAPREAIRSLVGRTISHYRIVAKLGSGGMGVVCRAKDVRLQRHVALKFSTNDMLAGADPYECILREAHAGAMVNHPNVCAVYDIGEFQGLPFIVMELLEGQTLKERIKEPLTLGRFLHLAIQVSDGLDAVHSKGIVHRDIKPSNIFITAADHAKIFDFSLAMIAHRPVSQHPGRGDRMRRRVRPDPGWVCGTPVYMSPEHILGEPLDFRTDLFSLGVVFHEMLTGKRPFKAAALSGITNWVPAGPFFSISELRRDLPMSIAQLVEKALERDREFRCQTAAEVSAELKRIQRDLRLEGIR